MGEIAYDDALDVASVYGVTAHDTNDGRMLLHSPNKWGGTPVYVNKSNLVGLGLPSAISTWVASNSHQLREPDEGYVDTNRRLRQDGHITATVSAEFFAMLLADRIDRVRKHLLEMIQHNDLDLQRDGRAASTKPVRLDDSMVVYIIIDANVQASYTIALTQS